MEKITPLTREKAISILMDALRDVPGPLRVIKKDRNFEARLRAFCVFCVDVAVMRNGAFITSDRKGVAIIFDNRRRVKLIPIVKEYLRLGSKCIGWDRVIPVLWKQRKISSRRLRIDHLQFWTRNKRSLQWTENYNRDQGLHLCPISRLTASYCC